MNRDPGLDPIVRHLGRCDYEPTWRRMQVLTEDRGEDSADEIWFLEHPPVYTVGLNGDMAHVLNPAEIPVINIDRGGQVTYHGPGQLVVYPLLDLRRRRLGVRNLVEALESAVVDYVAEFGIEAAPRRDAPGVYVDGAKLAALGLRIRRGCSYHGLAFNVAMDLSPFHGINPCGFEGLDVTQLSDLGGPSDLDEVARGLEPHLMRHLARREPDGG